MKLAATNFRMLLADVPAFRTWVGAADQAAALARIYDSGADEGSYSRPFVLVGTADDVASHRVAGGAQDDHGEIETLFVLFEDDTTGGAEPALRAFLNGVGGILSGIQTLAGKPGYLAVRSIRLVEGPRRSDDDESGDYYQALFAVEWGVG